MPSPPKFTRIHGLFVPQPRYRGPKPLPDEEYVEAVMSELAVRPDAKVRPMIVGLAASRYAETERDYLENRRRFVRRIEEKVRAKRKKKATIGQRNKDSGS